MKEKLRKTILIAELSATDRLRSEKIIAFICAPYTCLYYDPVNTSYPVGAHITLARLSRAGTETKSQGLGGGLIDIVRYTVLMWTGRTLMDLAWRKQAEYTIYMYNNIKLKRLIKKVELYI